MSAQGAALDVKAAALAAGYPPEMFSGHSLRAGFLTEAGRQNANLFKMKEHSRHASIEMVSEYVRDHERLASTLAKAFFDGLCRHARPSRTLDDQCEESRSPTYSPGLRVFDLRNSRRGLGSSIDRNPGLAM